MADGSSLPDSAQGRDAPAETTARDGPPDSPDAGPSPEAGPSCDAATSGDPANCGACGHSCLGGACVGASCQPVVLAPSRVNPLGIAVDANHVYWTDYDNGAAGGAVLSVPIAGGAVSLLAMANAPYGITVDANAVYWTQTDGQIFKEPLHSTTPVRLAMVVGQPQGIVVDATYAYWANAGNGHIERTTLSGGGTVDVLVTGQPLPNDVVLSGGNLYWVNSGFSTVVGMVGWIPADGGVPALTGFPNCGGGAHIAIGTNIYWTTQGPDHAVQQASLSGGMLPNLTVATAQPDGIAVDANAVYWADSALGTIERAPLDGGAPTAIAVGQMNPRGLAIDGNAVYWTNAVSMGGAVLKLAKP